VDVLRIKEESSFVLICGCYIFFISVGEQVKRKAFCIRKVDIPAAGDASKETHCTSATLGIVPSTVNTTVTIRKDAKNCCAQCGRFCGQRKGLK
jgi:hypothetical protein